MSSKSCDQVWHKSVYSYTVLNITSSGGSRGDSGGSTEPPLESKLFHFRGEFRENVGEIVSSNPPWQIWTPGSKILDPPLTSIGIILSKRRTTKALIRLRGCAGWSAPLLFAYICPKTCISMTWLKCACWSAPLLFAYVLRHVFPWPGSNAQSDQRLCCSHMFLDLFFRDLAQMSWRNLFCDGHCGHTGNFISAWTWLVHHFGKWG